MAGVGGGGLGGGGAFTVRDQLLSLLARANNNGDLAVKLDSLEKFKDILVSSSGDDPNLAAEVFPYLPDLHSSPQPLLRKSLIQVMEKTVLKVMEHSAPLMQALVTLVKDRDPDVARQAIVTGINVFCSVLEEMAVQFNQYGRVERWIEELWGWTLRLKDSIFEVALEPGHVKMKLLAMKFLETCVLLFTFDANSNQKSVFGGKSGTFNISWVSDRHPILDTSTLNAEANRTFGILLSFLQNVSSLPGPLTIAVVNCLATIASKRPIYYGTVLSTLLNFDPNSETRNGAHVLSIQYSIRTAFLGFLRCTHPTFLESRDRLLKALRAANAGDAADQVIRQVDKLIRNNERVLREARKDDQSSIQLPMSSDSYKKRSFLQDSEEPANNHESMPKRSRYAFENHFTTPFQKDDADQRDVSANGVAPPVQGDLTPVEQMVSMICALLAEGERGAESLDILISNIHPDLLADIVINNMKHLPKASSSMTRLVSVPNNYQIGSANSLPQAATMNSPTSAVPSVQAPFSSASGVVTPTTEHLTPSYIPADFKRDPRRDMRQMDPRRPADSMKTSSIPISEEIAVKSDFNISLTASKDSSGHGTTAVENLSVDMMHAARQDDLESLIASEVGLSILKEQILDEVNEMDITLTSSTSDLAHQDDCGQHEDHTDSKEIDFFLDDEDPISNFDLDQDTTVASDTSAYEEAPRELPSIPSYMDLTDEQQRSVGRAAIERVTEFYKHLSLPALSQTRMTLISRLVAQHDGDSDILMILQNHLSSDYQEKKGHEVILHILYHLYTLRELESDGSKPDDSTSPAAVVYEKVFLAMARSLLDNLPASDKSFSRLFGEVPLLPDSALKLLEELCCSAILDHSGIVSRDGDRVTQGLGAVWSLIVGRPLYREACLNIALKCSVHSLDDVRDKAIRLVANKLYRISHISVKIEEFASNMLLSAIDQNTNDSGPSSAELKNEREARSQEPSVSDASAKYSPEAQYFMPLFFALCRKKPSLLQTVFDTYGRSPKSLKQAVNRNISVLIKALGSSSSELLAIISDPPQGSENLISIVLQILTEEKAPSPELIATVKLLYETKLKDASILIPVLSSLSKNEVLPVFPHLVNLPLEKFKTALAYILQGSAHTGPALTPVEVLVAIHDIIPEKEGIPLKKITDACSACFEQRIVFTQQVLAKALNQMVDQTPIPMLFMRTVIQAIDAFPSLVDCVMEILSKLVNKQVWRMPKLWIGFLKFLSQTLPHSFPVLLQLPPPQLESTLNKYASIRGLLVNYASQPSVKSSLPRSTLAVLGLANESHIQHPPPLHPPDNNSSVHGATPT